MLRLRDVVGPPRVGNSGTPAPCFNLAFAGPAGGRLAAGGRSPTSGAGVLPWSVLSGAMLVTSALLLGRPRAPHPSTATMEDDDAATPLTRIPST